MSTTIQLGQLITSEQGRDAVHVAIVPVVAGSHLVRAQHVLLSEDYVTAFPCVEAVSIGIVDPFLKVIVPKGEQCWVCLHPNTITSLRHEWTHPFFEKQEQALRDKIAKVGSRLMGGDSMAWLERFANDELSMPIDTLLDGLRRYVRSGQAIYLDFDTPEAVYEQAERMWRHFEAIGEKVPHDGHHHVPFRCAC